MNHKLVATVANPTMEMPIIIGSAAITPRTKQLVETTVSNT